MKNLKKKLTLTGLMTAGLLFLSGCVQTHVVDGVRVPTEAATHGITYNFLVRPMSAFVDLFANNLHMGYGWGIIFVTLIIRFLNRQPKIWFTLIFVLNLRESFVHL